MKKVINRELPKGTKCVYYSRYPYMASDYGRTKETITLRNGNKVERSKYTMPFRLYKAAECENTKPMSLFRFLNSIWEGLDEAEHCRRIKSIHEPFYIRQLKVTPTKHLYGATNSMDGIYIIENDHDKEYYLAYYGGWRVCESWREAFDDIINSWEINIDCFPSIDYNPAE